MPIYEYGCVTCGQQFDALVRSVGRELQVACPACQGTEAQRLISALAVHIAGEGGRDRGAEEPPPPRPPVFGRKELNEALGRKK